MPTVLVVVDQVLQLISMDHDVETTDLGQTELLSIHAGEAHLQQWSQNILIRIVRVVSTLPTEKIT